MHRPEARTIRRAVAAALADAARDGPRTFLVAVSGGPDSVCLGHAAAAWARAGGSRIVVAHFDHALRPDSPADAEFVAGLARAWGTGFELGRAEPGPDPGSGRSPERWARRVRWEFLEAAARRHRAAAILTAHHLGDQAETLLLRLLRGAGSAGLGGMPVVAGGFDPPRIRPLLPVPRAAIESYLAEEGLPSRQDPSNREATTDRNRIRLGVMPLLEQIRPGAQQTIARAAENLRAESELLAELARAAWPRAGVREHHGASEFDAERFGRLEPVLQLLLLRDLCVRVSGQVPRRAVLESAREFAGGGGPASLQVTPAAVIERSRGRCLLRPASWRPPTAPPARPIAPGAGPVSFLGYAFRLTEGADGRCGGRVRLQLPSHPGSAEIAAVATATPALAGLPRWRRGITPGLHLEGRLVWGLGLGVMPRPLPPGAAAATYTLGWDPPD